MRINVSHKTVYRYAETARAVIQILHLTPRSHEGQFVVNWSIDVDLDCRLSEFEDSLGNIAHSFTAEGAIDRVTITVLGEIETSDTGGMVRGAVERLPPAFYLRQSDLTRPDHRIRRFAERLRGKADDTLSALHAINGEIYKTLKFDVEPTSTETRAADAFRHKRGVCQDFAHIFASAARHLGIPARYVGGYLMRQDGVVDQDAGHAWAEAWVDDLGWVGFDPAHGISPGEAHIRVAIGLDYLGAAPVRGTRYGGAAEEMDVAVNIAESGDQ